MSSKIPKTKTNHFYGGLGLYKGRPTAIAGEYNKHGFVETLIESEWIDLAPHPRLLFCFNFI